MVSAYPYYAKKELLEGIFKVPFGCKVEFEKPFYITDRYGEMTVPKFKSYCPMYYKKFIHINNTNYLNKYLSREFYRNYKMHLRYHKGYLIQVSKYGLYYLDYKPFEL